jgi:hypothetical protein
MRNLGLRRRPGHRGHVRSTGAARFVFLSHSPLLLPEAGPRDPATSAPSALPSARSRCPLTARKFIRLFCCFSVRPNTWSTPRPAGTTADPATVPRPSSIQGPESGRRDDPITYSLRRGKNPQPARSGYDDCPKSRTRLERPTRKTGKGSRGTRDDDSRDLTFGGDGTTGFARARHERKEDYLFSACNT